MAVEQIAGTQREGVLLCPPDDQPEILQKAADLVLDIALDLDEQCPAGQQRFDGMAVEALNADLLISASLHDAGNPDGVVAVTLVDL